jgi:hypothetical protein
VENTLSAQQHIAMLNIATIVDKWKDHKIAGGSALRLIGTITIELQKAQWEASHS